MLKRVVIADADVYAANLGLVLAPVTQETHDFTGGKVAVVDPALCIACGRCAEVCRFDAVREGDAYTVDPIACEGCAACTYECRVNAIEMEPQHVGQWFVATTRYGPLYHAHLFAGQENSGKLVTLVKQMARLRAFDDAADLLLVDGPPGIGCPVIAALSGADLALIVTEPTISGIHDLKRVLGWRRTSASRPRCCSTRPNLAPRRPAPLPRTGARLGDSDGGATCPTTPAVTEAMASAGNRSRRRRDR